MTILEAANLHVPMVIRDLDLYKEILMGHYMRGDSVEEFTELLHVLSSTPEVYAQYQEESRKISEYYSADHVLSMWKTFYVQAWKYKDHFRS